MAAAPKKNSDLSTYAGRFAARLRALREKTGKTVEQVVADMAAEGYTVARRSFYNWEQATNSPPIESFPAIARALELKTIRSLLPEK